MIRINLLIGTADCTGPCCRAKAIPGRKQCPRHFRIGRANQHYGVALRQRRSAAGLCRHCELPHLPDSIFCEQHRTLSQESVRRFRSTEKGKETNRIQGTSQYFDRKRSSLCTTCGSSLGEKWLLLKCDRCSKADAQSSIARIHYRKTNGLCRYCSEPVTRTTGRKRHSCDSCRKIHKGYDGTLRSRFSRARSSRGRKYGWSLTFTEYVTIVSQPCSYCELDNSTDQGAGLDRQDNNDGYHSYNVVSCCPECNMVRNDIFTPVEMKILGQAVRQIKLARQDKTS
jgi:hypothetical protein